MPRLERRGRRRHPLYHNATTGVTPAAHVGTHESGGSDALSLALIAGTLVDAQVPAGVVTQHQAALSIATTQLTGTLSDATVAESNVTQHEAALTILETQITDGSILGRLAASEVVTGLWDFTHVSGLKTDTIVESGAAAGVTVDGLLIKDAGIPEAAVTTHEAALSIAASQVTAGTFVSGDFVFQGRLDVKRGFDEHMRLDHTFATGSPTLTFLQTGTQRSFIQHADTGDVLRIASQYGAVSLSDGSGGTETERLLISGGLVTTLNNMQVNGNLIVDTIAERTATSGVTVDGLLIKDAGIPEAAVTAHEAALSIATTQLTGTLSDATVAESNVTQHEAALSIAASQVTAGTFDTGSFTFAGALTVGGIVHLNGATGELLKLDDTSATGNPFMSWWQAGVRRSYIQHFDTDDRLKVVSGYGPVGLYGGSIGSEVLVADFAETLATILKDLQVDGDIGFYGTTPVAQSSAYTPTNVSTDRAYDADSTTTDELADVLGTLIADLQATGLIG